jgi:hypothetical protein
LKPLTTPITPSSPSLTHEAGGTVLHIVAAWQVLGVGIEGEVRVPVPVTVLEGQVLTIRLEAAKVERYDTI